MRIIHPIPPLFDEASTTMILGSFPSVKSREQAFFYGHPQNRFWKVIAALYHAQVPQNIEEKKILLTRCHIAIWDVIGECEITGSSDSSIHDVVPNDLNRILEHAPIQKIWLNGKTAEKYYLKYTEKIIHRKAQVLPSTSPANAAWNLEKLTDAWSVILDKTQTAQPKG